VDVRMGGWLDFKGVANPLLKVVSSQNKLSVKR